MKRILCGVAVCCFTVMVSAVHAEQPLGGESGSPESKVSEHPSVTGVVSKIDEGVLFMETDQGTIREFSLNSVKRETINALVVGDRLELKLNDGNQIIKMSRVGPEGVESGFPQSTVSEHRSVTGAVAKIEAGMVYLKTDEGATRKFSLNSVRREKITDLAVGDRLDLEVNDGNQIIEISRVSPDGLKHQEPAQIVEGQVDRYDPMMKVVTLTLGDGTSQSYRLKEAAAVKMNAVKTGTSVRLKFDPVNGRVNDVTVL